MTSKHTRLSALPCSAQVPDWFSKESLPPLALPPPLPASLRISAVPLLLNKPEVTLQRTPGLSEVTLTVCHEWTQASFITKDRRKSINQMK